MFVRILTEASGSLVSAFLIRAIQAAKHTAIASDLDANNAGRFLADEFIKMPSKDDPLLWNKIAQIVKRHRIDVVIPSFDETLEGWAMRRDEWRIQLGVYIITSPPEAIHTFLDKWETYRFFMAEGIPTAATSLQQDYPLVKPRQGRGAKGVCIPGKEVDMEGMISQEVLSGQEYTLDVLCDRKSHPVYVVPRRRIKVVEGKTVTGLTERLPFLRRYVNKICKAARLEGPLNIQCFVDNKAGIRFTEVNPRIAGGMALGFAATENWISLLIRHFIQGNPLKAKPVKYGMRMYRYYAECFIPGN